jgi:MFS family permease
MLLGVGVLVNYGDRVNISVAHDALHSEFGISTVAFGYLLSAFNWTYALAQLPMGVLLDKFGVKQIGRIGSFLWSAATFGASVAPSLGSFFAMRLLLGIGEAPTFPSNAKAIGEWFPRGELSLATAIFDSAAKLGPAIGVPAVGIILIHYGWRWSFAATGLISFLYFLAFCGIYRDPEKDAAVDQNASAGRMRKKGADNVFAGRMSLISDHATSAKRAVCTLFTHPANGSAPLSYLLLHRKIVGLVTGFFGYNYCFYLFLLWLPTYFSGLKLDPLHSVIYSSVPWLVATLTDLLVGGFLVDHLIRLGRDESRVRLGVLIGGTAVGLAITGPMFTTNPGIALVWITISLAGLSAAAPVGWSIPSLIAPGNSVGKVGSILNTGNQIAGIVAPIITGYIVGGTNSFVRAFAVAALLLVAGIGSYIFLLGRIERLPEQC